MTSNPVVSCSTSAGPINIPLVTLQKAATLNQGLLADAPTLAIGQLYFAEDVQILYVGTSTGNAPTTALPLTGLAADVPQDAPAGFLYFATDTNVLYVALGEGSKLVVPPLAVGALAAIPNLAVGAFYLTTDTNSIYIGTGGGNILVGPSPAPSGPANEVLATPNGSSGVSSLRSLVTADIPALPYDASGAAASAQSSAQNFATNAVSTESSRAQAAEALLAPKASPTFTGTVTAPSLALTGLVSQYNGIATVDGGIPSIVAAVDLTAQVAAKTTTTLYMPTVTGWFRLNIRLLWTAATTSGVIGPVTLTYTDGDSSVAQSVVMALNNQLGASVKQTSTFTTVTQINGDTYMYAKAGVAITYAIAQSGTIGAGQWSAHIRLEIV